MIKITAITCAALVALAACKSAPKADEAKTEEQKEVAAANGVSYTIDTTQQVHFIGTKPVGEHKGAFPVSEGNLVVQDGNTVTGGKITLAIGRLSITDADTSGSSKLTGHLLSPDFFEAAKFPTASFEITSLTAYIPDSTQQLVLDGATHTATGNLTLKGVTKSVSFPVILAVSDASVKARANFNIDRTQWGLVYGNDQSLGDKFIRPEVNVNFELTAKK